MIKKIFFIFSLILLMSLLFLGCGENSKVDIESIIDTTKEESEESVKSTDEIQDDVTENKVIQETEKDKKGSVKFTVLDVDNALSVLIESDGKTCLYDGGGRDRSSYVVSYLKSHDISKIDLMIASHYDEDHIAGLIGVLNTFDVDRVLSLKEEKDTDIYRSFIKMLGENGADTLHPKKGDSFTVGSIALTVLSEEKEECDNDNNQSIVISVTCDDFTVLLPGDAESEEELQLIESFGENLKSDVLIAAHHGSSTSTSSAFLRKVNPDFVIISCGKQNPYGHPHKETMERIEATGAALYRTDLQKEIIFTYENGEVNFSIESTEDFSFGKYLFIEETEESKITEVSTEVSETTIEESTKETVNTISEVDIIPVPVVLETEPKAPETTSYETIEETVPVIEETVTSVEPETEPSLSETSYVANKNTKKFHYPSCRSVSDMSEKNRWDITCTRDDLINMGFDPCKNCNP